MTTEHRFPGLNAGSLNAWLAAIGITVLLEDARIAWSTDRRPVAILSLPDGQDPWSVLAMALPSMEALKTLLISNESGSFPRQVSLETFATAAAEGRASPGDWSLAASVTDLTRDAATGNLLHSSFDVAAPRGETLWMRVRACRAALPSDEGGLVSAIRGTMEGRGRRQPLNGLGFDVQRIEAGDPPEKLGGKFVDPLIEFLAFFGLWLFPVRGDGMVARTRGWKPAHQTARATSTTFRWSAWSAPLDRWGVDALLGRLYADSLHRNDPGGPGLVRTFELIRYRKTGDMDQTAGYASRSL